VIKVVSGRDSVAKLVCQNDEFASSLENTTAFASLAKDSSIEGSGKFSGIISNVNVSSVDATIARDIPKC
jgi:hypothetical protein